MADRHGVAHWPGASGCLSATYTVSHGVTPGVATMEIPEQDVNRLQPYGTFVITDGQGAVALPRARLAAVSAVGGSGGEPRRILLHIQDRRWMWEHGGVSGEFNVRDPFPDPDVFPDGEFVAPPDQPFAPGTFRPTGLLMADCLAAMGEQLFAVDPPPAQPVPVRWSEEPPAYALQALAEACGYRVCYRTVSDTVLVTPLGVGAPLPAQLPLVTHNPEVSMPLRPAAVQLFGGDTIFNETFALEPVGVEPSGQIKPLNELSYRPRSGDWTHCNPLTMDEATATDELSEREAKDLAKRCVWRMFRVKLVDVQTLAAPGPNVPGFGTVRDRKQVVLLPTRFGVTKRADGQPDTTPPSVHGSIYLAREAGVALINRVHDGGNSDPASGSKLPRVPQIDTARGVVTFDRQCYRVDLVAGRVHYTEPLLFLSTGCHLRSLVGRVPHRFVQVAPVVGAAELGCPPETLRHPELVAITSVVRNVFDRTVITINDNADDLRAAADFFIEASNLKYEAKVAQSATYAGIFPWDLDGAIQQVTWSVGNGAATTRVSRNSEHDVHVPAFSERRRDFRALNFFLGADRVQKVRAGPLLGSGSDPAMLPQLAVLAAINLLPGT